MCERGGVGVGVGVISGKNIFLISPQKHVFKENKTKFQYFSMGKKKAL